MRLKSIAPVAAAAALVAGCGGSDASGLRDGVYEFELTESYLVDNGIPAEQAERESGVHEITIDDGSFRDQWRTQEGSSGSCGGTYVADGNRVTFRWTDGCTGDWAMTYSGDGDRLTWSDFETLDPNATAEERKVTEVFNGVPWKRTGDVPEDG